MSNEDKEKSNVRAQKGGGWLLRIWSRRAKSLFSVEEAVDSVLPVQLGDKEDAEGDGESDFQGEDA